MVLIDKMLALPVLGGLSGLGNDFGILAGREAGEALPSLPLLYRGMLSRMSNQSLSFMWALLIGLYTSATAMKQQTPGEIDCCLLASLVCLGQPHPVH